ncbi:MAG: hypothetical protein K9N09_09005 [Candidatus Cloacimonetes bacterium]|nr:hypothetical protein [Candidatus Cloacimonadota bacterium]MCF7813981.1 hypothetical protein [Candidatus Cloacimonadota bacterium]MCF7868825.1 hypothetical protein [Candidatus Cloacimonadota bacterium]MCF7884084.1 hypothetical protein [Candidatus Cloacimonadota bacterium]
MNEKQKALIKYAGIALLLIIIIFSISKCIRRSSVLVEGLPEVPVYFNENGKELKVGKTNDDGLTSLNQKLQPGSYIIYYQEDYLTRYYATLRVRKSRKETKVRFRKHRLPAISRQLVLNKSEDVELASTLKHYSIYSKSGNAVEYDADINMSVRGSNDGLDSYFILKWNLNLEGRNVSNEELEIAENTSKTMTVWEDKLHLYEIEYSVNGDVASLSLRAKYKE